MEELIKITGEELKDKRLTGMDDTPALSAIAMQRRFDAHPDRNTEVINQNADIQNRINEEFSTSIGRKVENEEGKGLSQENFTSEMKNKLQNVEESANRYVLPVAGPSVLGGVKAGKGVAVLPDGTLEIAGYIGGEGVYVGAKLITAAFSIPVGAWYKNKKGPYAYTAIVSVPNARRAHYPVVTCSMDSLEEAKKADFCKVAETMDGLLAFKCQNKPETEINMNAVLLSDATGNDGTGIATNAEVFEMLDTVF